MAYGDEFETKLIIHIKVKASSKERAERKWEDTLEKLKYQMSGIEIKPQLEPNWILVEKEPNDNATHWFREP